MKRCFSYTRCNQKKKKRCNHWGKLGKKYMDFSTIFAISYKPYIYFKIKRFLKKDPQERELLLEITT